MSQMQGETDMSDPAASPAEKEKEFKPMRMGDPLRYPLPKIDGDPFVMLLESRMMKDKVRCDAWKDEVQNLLIFAGLFSAVVTAFIIESYKALKQDPSEILLSRILAQLEGRVNETDILTTPKFIPTSSDIRVNILWFLSLIFSLATVLIGIIALQWLREHLRPYTDLEPQIAFSLHHLNVESLDRWYLPQIFTALPLLLQLALILFLAGVLDFLWSLNSAVFIPIAIAIGSTVLFLLWTTILPTTQALLLFFSRFPWGTMPRSPCPYRSPQSWAFHQLVQPLVAIFLSTSGGHNVDHWGVVSHSMLLESDRGLSGSENISSRQRRPINLIFCHSSGDSWAKIGIAWLFQRDLDFMGQNPRRTKKTSINKEIRPVPMYDTVRAIINIGRNGSSQDNLLAHHCIQPIVQCNKTDGAYMWYLSYLAKTYLDLDGDRAETVSVDALMHHHMLFLPRKIGSGQVDEVRNSVMEPLVKITHAMFANGAIRLDNIWARRYSPLTYWVGSEFPDGQEQLFDILQSYFRNAATYDPDAADAGSTTYFSAVGIDFIHDSAHGVSRFKPTSPLFSRHDNLLQSLASHLRDLHDDPEAGLSPDYLFFASFAYVYKLIRLESDTITTESGRDLILAIYQYRERVTPRKDFEDGFYNLNPYRWTFENHWLNFVNRAKELGIVDLPPAQDSLADLQPLEYSEIQEESPPPSGDVLVEVPYDHHDHALISSSSKTDDINVLSLDRERYIEIGDGNPRD